MKLSNFQYRLKCWACGESTQLALVPHRDKADDNVVGILVICEQCFEKLHGKDINIEIENDH